MALRLRTILGERSETRAVDFPEAVAEIRIGRRQDLELPLPFRTLSGLHARLVRDRQMRWSIEDLGSRNGTDVDGIPLVPREPRLLTPGARIGLGIVAVVFDGPVHDEPVPLAPRPEGTGTIARRLVNDLFAGEPGAGAPTLTVLSGVPPATLRLEAFDHPYVLGRVEGAALQLVADEISREHAALTRAWESVSVQDLGSKNGLRVNAARVTTARLSDGDVIEIGPVALRFTDPADRYLRDLEEMADAAPAAPIAHGPGAPAIRADEQSASSRDAAPPSVDPPSVAPRRPSPGTRTAILAAAAVLLAIGAATIALAIGTR
jgi:pSer/pThr/pTyr-binding forkhead associated (FHA) protein